MVFEYIMDELKIGSLNIKLGQLCKQVKDNMCNSFLYFWNGERVDAIGSNRGKNVNEIHTFT